MYTPYCKTWFLRTVRNNVYPAHIGLDGCLSGSVVKGTSKAILGFALPIGAVKNYFCDFSLKGMNNLVLYVIYGALTFEVIGFHCLALYICVIDGLVV